MASTSASDPSKEQNATLQAILATLKTMQTQQSQVSATVATLNARVDQLSIDDDVHLPEKHRVPASLPVTPTPSTPSSSAPSKAAASVNWESKKTASSSRIILTTYPGQSGIDPISMDWGNLDPMLRGPVTVSRHQNTVRRRNGKHVCLHHV